MIGQKRWVAGFALVWCAAIVQGCGDDFSASEERRHQERDAELSKSLGEVAGGDALNPFAAAQTLAEDSIGAATASSVDQTWVRKMIEHQEGAARMAQILMNTRPTPEGRSAAQRVAQDAHARVEMLKKLRKRPVGSDDSPTDVFDARTSEIFAKMTQVQARSIEQTWALKMIEYDGGAVILAGLEVAHGQDVEVKASARELASALAHEVDTLRQFAGRGR